MMTLMMKKARTKSRVTLARGVRALFAVCQEDFLGCSGWALMESYRSMHTAQVWFCAEQTQEDCR
jgi:hypothetical protein